MNKYVRLTIAILAVAAYLLALRYIAPSDQPYFILGIGIIGVVAWLLGTAPGLVTALLLIPATNFVYQQFTLSTSYLSFAGSPAYLSIQILAAVTLGRLRRGKINLTEKESELAALNLRLKNVLSQVQELGGVHNLCSECKAIQDDEGNWLSIDHYLKDHTKMELSHCMCPGCAENFQAQLLAQKSA